MKEIWKVYKESNLSKTHGKYRKYEVSNLGRVKKNGIIVELKSSKIGYYNIGGFRIHRAVAKLFVPNPNNYDEVDHIDGNKLNNNASNLEWVTRKENMKRYFNSELYKIRHKKFIEKLNNKIKKEKIKYIKCYYYKDKIFCYFNDLFNFINSERIQKFTISQMKHYCYSKNIFKQYYTDGKGNIYDSNKP